MEKKRLRSRQQSVALLGERRDEADKVQKQVHKINVAPLSV